MNNTDLELKRANIEKWGKVIAFPIAAFFFATVGLTIIQGMVEFLVTAVIALLTVNVGIPWFSKKLANWRINALKRIAMQDPIATLESEYQERDSALKVAAGKIKCAIASRGTFASKLEGFKQKYADVSKYVAELAQMDTAINQAKTKYKNAQDKLEEFYDIIQKASAEWDLAKSAQDASDAIGMTGGDFMSKLMETTALDSVQQNLNMAFADLETSSLTFKDDNASKQLTEGVVEADIVQEAVKAVQSAPIKVKARR